MKALVQEAVPHSLAEGLLDLLEGLEHVGPLKFDLLLEPYLQDLPSRSCLDSTSDLVAGRI